MNSKILLVLVVAVAVSGCASYSNSAPNDSTEAPSNSTDTADNPNATTHTVTYTGSGFQPATITVKEGDTVRWVAESGSMWVASDQHPKHTEYDGTSRSQHCSSNADAFDQCQRGQSFSFTFDKTGSWSYHNHFNQVQTGTVVVE